MGRIEPLRRRGYLGLGGLIVVLFLVALFARPPGEDAGPAGGDGPRTVLGLGDSVTSAAGCDCAGFVADVAAGMGRRLGWSMQAENLGRAGQTSVELLAAVATDPITIDAIEAAADGVIVVTIGANDLLPLRDQWRTGTCTSDCYSRVVDATAQTIGQALRLIRARAPEASVVATSYWNVFEDGPKRPPAAERLWSQDVTRAFNAALIAACEQTGTTYVDLFVPFNGSAGSADPTRYLASDGDHPNAAGHALIAAEILRRLGLDGRDVHRPAPAFENRR